MITDLTLPEERTNIYSFLQQCQHFCLNPNQNTARSFQLLYEVWEKVSGKLWYWGYRQDYYQCACIVLQCAKAVKQEAIEAQVSNEIGFFLMEREEYEIAQKQFENSLKIYQMLQNVRRECQTLRYLGILRFQQNRFQDALEYFQTVLQVIQSQHHEVFVDKKWKFYRAEIPNLMGETYLELKQFEDSYRNFHISIEEYKLLVQEDELYWYYFTDVYLNLGRWHFLQKNYDHAQLNYQHCLQLSQKLKRPDQEAKVWLWIAKLEFSKGNLNKAIETAKEAEKIAGIEHPTIRDQAARFQATILGHS